MKAWSKVTKSLNNNFVGVWARRWWSGVVAARASIWEGMKVTADFVGSFLCFMIPF